jgi:hypothetical protein
MTMSNLLNVLDARTDKIVKHFTNGLDAVCASTIAEYTEAPYDPRVKNVLSVLSDIVRSRSEKQMNLLFRGLRPLPDEDLTAILKQLDASPEPVVNAFIERVRNAVDLEDPLVFSAFNAAGGYLVGFLQLENEFVYEYFKAVATHSELTCNARPQQTRRASRSRRQGSARKKKT